MYELRLFRLLLLIAISALLASPPVLAAVTTGVPVGVSGDTELTIVAEDDNNGGYHFDFPATITIDPSSDFMIKTFTIPGNVTIVPGMVFPVWEHITILPSPTGMVPTDWHEEIIDTSFGLPFGWSGNSVLIVHNTDEEVPGLTDGISIDFEPILTTTDIPPTEPIDLWIHKEIVYNGNVTITPSGQPITITVIEFPTVPEPTSFALLSFAGILMMKRRR